MPKAPAAIKRALIVDTETGGLQETDPLVEIGLVLYSVQNQCTLREFSTLLPVDSNDAVEINRINVRALQEVTDLHRDGIFGVKSVSMVLEMIEAADCYVAHHADFDRTALSSWRTYFDDDVPWLCTMEDFQWPHGRRRQGSLVHLALDHDLGVATSHRALSDCQLIARLFDCMESPRRLQEMFQHASRPKALFIGEQRFEDNDLAKEWGFKFNRLVPNQWARRMAVEDVRLLPFKVKRVKEEA